jgi:hypothetical protein
MQKQLLRLLGVIGALVVLIAVGFFIVQQSKTIVIDGVVSVPSVVRTEMACMILPDSEIDPENPPTCNGFGGNVVLTALDGTEYGLIDEDGGNYICGGVETYSAGGWEDVYSGCDGDLVQGDSYSVRGVLDEDTGLNIVVQSIKPL